MFKFSPEKYDFWPAYDCVKKYYPLGFTERGRGSYYEDYPGFKAAVELLTSEIHDHDRFQQVWRTFEQQLTARTGLPLLGTTFGQAPSYSAITEIARTTAETITHVREVHCYVSILGPFYSVVGVDRSEVNGVRSTNFLVPSPEGEYAETFIRIQALIEERFPGFRFVPLEICAVRMPGLRVWYMDEDERSDHIFNGLFSYLIDVETQTVGDRYYGANAWIKEGYVEPPGKWTAGPPRRKNNDPASDRAVKI